MSKDTIRYSLFVIRSFCIHSFFILLSLLLWGQPVGAQGDGPPHTTDTPTPVATLTLMPTSTSTPIPTPTLTPTPTSTSTSTPTSTPTPAPTPTFTPSPTATPTPTAPPTPTTTSTPAPTATATSTPAPAATPTLTLTVAPTPVFSPSPTRAPLRPDVTPFDGSLILDNPLLWGLARRMLAGLGVANIRDYLAVVFALMGIARLIAKPPTVPE